MDEKHKNLIKKGVVTSEQLESSYNATAQITSQDCPLTSEVIYSYGTAGNSGVGSACLTFQCFAQSDNISSITYNPQNRFKNLKQGEYICGNQFTQTYIKFDENGDIEIKSNAKVMIMGDVEIVGKLEVTQDIIASTESNSVAISSIKTTYNEHTHNNENEPPTLPPNELIT